MKIFVKALNKDDRSFKYLREKFPCISDVKINEGIFVDFQIMNVMSDNHFDKLLKMLS